MREPVKFTSIISERVVGYNIKNLRNLVFEVTDACNLRCKYCGFSEFYDGYDERKDSFMPFDLAKTLIDHLAEIWRNHQYEDIQQPLTVGFYGGEPLLNMKFIKQVVDYFDNLTDIGKRITYNMTTNAMLLDKHMDFLVDKKFRLLISLDGDKDGQSYRLDKYGNNSFSTVVDNIRLLQAKYPDYFRDNINFNTVLHNRNDVETVYNFIKTEFDKTPRISALNDSGIKPEKKAEFYRTYKNVRQSFESASNCKQMIDDVFISVPHVSSLANYIFEKSGNVFDDYASLRIDKKILGVTQTGTCTPFMLKLFLTVNGKILQCEKINHTYALGHVYDDRVELNYDNVVALQNGYLNKIVKQCKNCARAKMCDLCVYQIDYLDTNSVVQCPYFTISPQDDMHKDDLDFLSKNPHLYKRIIEEVSIK